MRKARFWARGVPHRAFTLTVLAAGCMIAAAIIAVFGAVWQSRADALEMAKSGASDLASLLAAQVSNSVQGIDLVLDDVKHRAEQLGSGLEVPDPSMSEFLEGRLARLPQADVIAIFDRHGRVINTSRTNNIPTDSFVGRDYFSHHVEHRSGQLFISEPVISQVTGHWTTYFSRRLETESGEFLGIAMVGVRPEALMQLHGQAASLVSTAFLLLRRDGTVLARFPEVLRQTGFRMPAESAWYAAVDGGGRNISVPRHIRWRTTNRRRAASGKIPIRDQCRAFRGRGIGDLAEARDANRRRSGFRHTLLCVAYVGASGSVAEPPAKQYAFRCGSEQYVSGLSHV